MLIRKFRSADAVELAQLHRGTVRNINSKDYSKKHIDAWSSRISAKRFRNLEKEKTRFVAVEKGKIIGFADYVKEELTGIYVHKNSIGKSVGKKLLQKIETHAANKGITKLKCSSTITAHKFYERNGFRTIKKSKYRIKNHMLSVFIMEKRLT